MKTIFLKKRVRSLFVLKVEYFFENKKRLDKPPLGWLFFTRKGAERNAPKEERDGKRRKGRGYPDLR